MKRKIMGLGKYSDVISLPKEFLEKLGWRRGQMLDITSTGKSITVKDFKNKK
jgi:bifunctional DNA-binding transcriptional regulator/antitoxin component of YhaV-PrlF toxin-antitoxin module